MAEEDAGLIQEPTDSGTAVEAPVETGSEMGAGILDGDAELGSLPDEGQPEQEIAPVPEEDKAGTLMHADYTRKTMDLADQRRQFEAEREGWHQQREADLQARQQQLQPQAEQPLSGQIQQVMSNPELSAEDRMGLGVISSLSQMVEDQQFTIAELQETVNSVLPQIQQTYNQSERLAHQELDAQKVVIGEQAAEARELFGADDVIGAQSFVVDEWGKRINPATGKKFTVAELVGMWNGKTVQERREAQTDTRRQQGTAKRRISSNGTTHASPTPAQGPLTKAQSLEQIKANM